jgi:hypothetical protein
MEQTEGHIHLTVEPEHVLEYKVVERSSQVSLD